MPIRSTRSALMAAVCLSLAACGGGGGGGGDTVPSPPPVTPPPVATAPQITGFTASLAAITAGQSSTLSWSVSGATSVVLNPGAIPVTTTAVVTPQATTDYTLTATNASGSTSATVRVTVNPFAVSDAAIGDASISYLQIEVSPDMRYMTWLEESQTGGPNVAWLCALDPVEGVLRPANGRGVRIADVPGIGSPQWGQDAQGIFSVIVDMDGRFVVARPSLNSDGTAAASITRLATAANLSREFPYASRLSNAPGYLVYHQDDAANSNVTQLWSLNLADPTRETQITQGQTAQIGAFGLPPFLVNVQRWFYDVATLGNGVPIIIYGDTVQPATGPRRLTVDQLDFTSGTGVVSRVSGSGAQLYDPFPFLHQGERYVIAGLDAGPVGSVLRRDAAGQYTTEVRRITTTGSSLTSPNNFASAEPFLRNGKLYTAYQLNEPGAPGTTNAEIWLTSVLDGSLMRQITPSAASRRADPEFFLGRDKVWILYYARTTSVGRWQLRRADTGL